MSNLSRTALQALEKVFKELKEKIPDTSLAETLQTAVREFMEGLITWEETVETFRPNPNSLRKKREKISSRVAGRRSPRLERVD